MTSTAPAPFRFREHSFELEDVPCDFCGSREFLPFWTKMRHGLDLPTVFCKKCGLCQTHPRPTAGALDLFYSKLYNHFHYREIPIDPDGEYVKRTHRHAGPRIDVLSRFLDPQTPHRVIEIGAGVGQTQRVARERTRWRISGIEPGQAQHAVCRHFGADVKNAFFDDSAGLEDGAYDAVVSFHVYEHVQSPAAFLRRANRLLRPGGLLHLEVPNLARPGVSLDEFLQFPHLYNFSAVTLRNYLHAVGGFRAIWSAERAANLVIVSRRIGEPSEKTPASDEFEGYDVENFITRLRMLERVFKLARSIPNVSLLGKVRGTLMGI